MKKQNRNVCAYIRQPNIQNSEQVIAGSMEKLGKANPTIYKEIVRQMDPGMTSYLDKLVHKNQKQEVKKKSMQKSLNHQRTKSYADILVGTPSNSKNTLDKGHSYRGSHPTTQLNNIFFSLNNTPTNQKPHIKANQKMQITASTSNNQFLQSLDNYLVDLSKTSSTINKYERSSQQLVERRTVQKSKENSLNNLKIIQRLQNASKKQKQLRVANHILENQNQKLINKAKRMKKKYKQNLMGMVNCMKQMHDKLTKVTNEKQILENTIQEFHKKISMVRPQRKTSGARPQRMDQYIMSSQTTQQDSTQMINPSYQFYQSEYKNNNMKRRSLPRNCTKHNKISSSQIQQMAAMISSDKFFLDDDDDDQNQNQSDLN